MSTSKTNQRWYDSASWRGFLAAACVLAPAALAALAYVRFLDEYFFRDDTVWIGAATNPDFLDFVRLAFTVPNGGTPYWRPLSDFYFFGMYRVFEIDAMSYHLANLLLHAATAALTSVMIQRLTRSQMAGLIAGALFAVAPAYGTGVVWVSTAGTLLAALFGVTTVILFRESLDERRGKAWLFAAFVAFLIALLLQEASIAIPAVLVILGVAEQLSRRPAEYRRLARFLIPFLVLGVAVVGLRIWTAYFTDLTGHEIDVHALGRLADRMRWLSFPLSPADYGSWANEAQWAAIATFTLAAAMAALRREWLAPALYASTVAMLLPSSVIDGTFEARLVYVAALFWAGFVAVLAMAVVRWLSERHALAAALALSVVAIICGLALVPRDTESQRLTGVQAQHMEDIKDALEDDCATYRPKGTVFILPLPIIDPSNFVPGLLHLVRADAGFVRAGAQPLPQPLPGDCVIEWRGEYQGTAVGADFVRGRFWDVGLTDECPRGIGWEEAARFGHKLVNVSGPVVDVQQTTFAASLEVGERGGLRIIIPGRDLSAFPPPGEAYAGQTVCVRGVVRVTLGQPTITIESPDMIVVTGASTAPQ